MTTDDPSTEVDHAYERPRQVWVVAVKGGGAGEPPTLDECVYDNAQAAEAHAAAMNEPDGIGVGSYGHGLGYRAEPREIRSAFLADAEGTR